MFPPLHIGTDQWWHNVTCHVTPWHVSQCHALASKGPRAMVSGEWMIGQQKNRLSIVNICCFCLSLPCLGLIGWDFVYFIEISILDILLDNLVHYDCGLLIEMGNSVSSPDREHPFWKRSGSIRARNLLQLGAASLNHPLLVVLSPPVMLEVAYGRGGASRGASGWLHKAVYLILLSSRFIIYLIYNIYTQIFHEM